MRQIEMTLETAILTVEYDVLQTDLFTCCIQSNLYFARDMLRNFENNTGLSFYQTYLPKIFSDWQQQQKMYLDSNFDPEKYHGLRIFIHVKLKFDYTTIMNSLLKFLIKIWKENENNFSIHNADTLFDIIKNKLQEDISFSSLAFMYGTVNIPIEKMLYIHSRIFKEEEEEEC